MNEDIIEWEGGREGGECIYKQEFGDVLVVVAELSEREREREWAVGGWVGEWVGEWAVSIYSVLFSLLLASSSSVVCGS